MSAILAAQDDEPRLYAKGFRDRAAVDEIAPQHQAVHAMLVRWGNWSRARSGGSSLASAEALYTGRGGTPASTAPMSADPKIMAVERVMLRMPMQHGDSLRLLYIRRYTATSICKAMHLRYEDWPRWIFDCRAMVRNLLRRHGV